MINDYLKGLTEAQRIHLYGITGGLVMPLFIAVLLLIAIRSKMHWKRATVLLVLFYASYRWAVLLESMLSRFTNDWIPSPNLGVAFTFFVLTELALALALKIPVFDILDATLPVYILGRGVGIFGCIFAGCCHGFPAEWGIYSGEAACNTVPTVPLDIILSWGIAVYMLCRLWREGRPGRGNVTAGSLALFGILRLVIDVLRDNRTLLLCFTVEGFCGAAYILAGYCLMRWRKSHVLSSGQDM